MVVAIGSIQPILTGKRVFVFRRCHARGWRPRASRAPRDGVRSRRAGLLQSRVRPRGIRATAAKTYGVEPLITDDYLDVEDRPSHGRYRPKSILGTQMERHIGKRLGHSAAPSSRPRCMSRTSPCTHFRRSDGVGRREHVLFDTLVHPLVMGLEEHLLRHVPRRLSNSARPAPASSHLGGGPWRAAPAGHGGRWQTIWVRPAWATRRQSKDAEENPVLRAGQSDGATPKDSLRQRAWPIAVITMSRRSMMPKRISPADAAARYGW